MFGTLKTSCLLAAVLIGISGSLRAEDLYLNDGLAYEIDYTIDGSLWVENATVSLYNPAHIFGFAITGSGAVLDIYGGQIDYMLLVSTSDNGLPDGVVTVYGTEFAVDGVTVAPDTPELFLSNQTLSGVYQDGTPFSVVVDCTVEGNAEYLHYQTVKLGWIVQQPVIEVSALDYDFGQADVGTEVLGAVTLHNAGNANLTVQSVTVVQDEPVQFGFTPLQVIPVTLEPGASIDIETWFAPAVGGESVATLQVVSSDPQAPLVEITLSGEGLALEVTPEQQIRDILDVLEQGFINGTITGVGRGRSAFNKAFVFTQTLITAKRLIDTEYDFYAVKVLDEAEQKCDGDKSPADFIEGPDAPVINAMIVELMQMLDTDDGHHWHFCKTWKKPHVHHHKLHLKPAKQQCQQPHKQDHLEKARQQLEQHLKNKYKQQQEKKKSHHR